MFLIYDWYEYVTLETKSIMARQIIISGWISNNNEMLMTDKFDFNEIDP
jgi:hypothetical protein